MSFTFNPDYMAQDLLALARGAADFLAPRSLVRVERLTTNLRNAVANAKAGGQASFAWRTDADAPIQVRASKSWKGGTDDFDPIAADIRLDYACQFLPATGRVKIKGVAVIVIRDIGGGGEKVVHFDVDEGGWSEVVNGQPVHRAGHPPFHAQFYGVLNDIPRMPSLIVYPVDVINFAILELHQKNWRQHVESFQAKSQLRNFPPRQRERLAAILQCWSGTVCNPDFHPLVAMQRPFGEPLSF
ncbi:hypothetical protein [Mesorhizobium sp. B1-1-8]|uniref:hypothetical protein n=1 Tax=Mesorhizobium sp. B1-1-8 TaxID=2589976 RepID=UPI0011260E11|nr:hypothetical protein [Mesorhizobium sp. B1-1-8]UCI07216.1 hypothetical protein FJ974_26075 [Mesorhizobium sp. B1-1-8]